MAHVAVSDRYERVRGFRIDFSNSGGKEVDTAWESVSGGEMIIELTETTIGSDKFKTNSPGHKTVGEITLRGAITDTRGPMCQWINETVAGRPWKRTITITPLNVDGSIGETLIFNECALTAYRLPRLTVPQPDDPCPPDEGQEEMRFTYTSWTTKP